MSSCEEESIGRLLYITTQSMTVQAEKALQPYDLTVEQLQILKNISPDMPLSQRQLCEVVQKRAANVTRILDRLERKGCIERTKNPDDRRSTLVSLTTEGEQLMADVSVLLESFIEQLTEGISPEEQESLTRLLKIMQENLNRLATK